MSCPVLVTDLEQRMLILGGRPLLYVENPIQDVLSSVSTIPFRQIPIYNSDFDGDDLNFHNPTKNHFRTLSKMELEILLFGKAHVTEMNMRKKKIDTKMKNGEQPVTTGIAAESFFIVGCNDTNSNTNTNINADFIQNKIV